MSFNGQDKRRPYGGPWQLAFTVLTAMSLQGATVVWGGYTRATPIYVAPGQIITFYVQGIGDSLTMPVAAPTFPLPTVLSGISASFVQGAFTASVPLFSIWPVHPCADRTNPGCGGSYVAITVQMPFGFSVNDPTVGRGAPVPEGQIRFAEEGNIVATIDLTPFSDQIHVLRPYCDGLVYEEASCQPSVTHSDGSAVDWASPAKNGEEIVIYAVGLGAPQVPVTAGQPSSAPVAIPVSVGFDFRVNALASRPVDASGGLIEPVYSGLVANYAGLYQINVIVPPLPPGTPACNQTSIVSNLTIDIIGHASFDGARVCVQP